MMGSFVDVLNVLLILVEIYIVSSNLFVRKSIRKRNALIYTFLVVLGMFVSVSYINNIVIKNVIQFFWFIVFIHWFFKGSIKVKMLFGAFFVISICLLNEFLYTVFFVGGEYLGIKSSLDNGSDIFSYLLAFLVTFACIFFVSYI